MKKANVIGAGLAGCEAAYQLAKRGVEVSLYEMKPQKKIPAHTTNDFCELCCSNSFRAEGLKNAIGLLKEELRMLDSLVTVSYTHLDVYKRQVYICIIISLFNSCKSF